MLLLGFLGMVGFLWAHVGAGMAVDREGRVYFIDNARNTMWRLEPDGRLIAIRRGVHGDALTIPDSGTPEYSRDEPALPFSLEGPGGTTYRIVGNRILRSGADGSETTLAGDSAPGYVDGPGPTARFNRPLRLSLDSAGNVYVADYGNHRVRKVAPDGAVATAALISWPWWPTSVAVWRDRVYVLERWGDYYRMPPVGSVVADLVGHPRLRVLGVDGSQAVVASVVGWPSRAIVSLVAVGIMALVIWRIRRALLGLRAPAQAQGTVSLPPLQR